MNKLIGYLLLVFATVAGATTPAVRFEEPTHFSTLANAAVPAADAKIEVYEFFMWTCPHCMQFEPYLRQWLTRKPADVELVKVPAAFDPTSALLARAYYALEALGEEQRLSDAFFNALVNERRRLRDEQAITSFVKQFGVDEAKFREAFSSFAVQAKVRRAEQLAERFRIDAVPKMVIDGRFRSGDGLASHDQLIGVTDFLIQEARGLRQPGTATR